MEELAISRLDALDAWMRLDTALLAGGRGTHLTAVCVTG